MNKCDWKVILIASLIPFGIHYSQAINSLKVYFTDDPLWIPPINGARWGLFQTIMNFPNLILPVIGGICMDALNLTRLGTICFLVCTLIGHGVFTMGVYSHDYPLSVAGRLVFGLGTGCVSSLGGAVAAKSFRKRNRIYVVPFALGLGESIHALTSLLSSILPIYIAEAFGNYWSALVVGGVTCIVSVLCGLCLWSDSDVDRVRVADRWRPLSVRVWECFSFMPARMYLILVIHFCSSGAHRLFSHVDTAFFYREYLDVDLKEAGFMSGSASFAGLFIPPVLGFFFTHMNRENPVKLPTIIMIISTFFGSMAYFMLARLMNPVLPLTILSVVNAFTPTVLKVLVATAVPFESYATAYGMFEASESAVKTFGGVLVGIDRDTTGSYIGAVNMFGCLLLGACLFSVIFLCFQTNIYRRQGELSATTVASRGIGMPLMSTHDSNLVAPPAVGEQDRGRLIF